jgi:transcriptional regulator with XRE-family HTH domain
MSEETRSAYEIGSFASYFRALIDNGPYTQQEVAHHLGVSTRSVTNYLSGDRIPGVPLCEHIAFLFGVSIAEVRAAAGKPLPTSIDSIFDKRIRSLMLGMDWTPRRLDTLTQFLEEMEREQEAERGSKSTRRNEHA